MYKANTVGVIDEKKTELYQVLARRRLFFKVDKKSILTAMRPALEFNNPTFRASFEEWCDQYAHWEECPFSDFCHRVQKQFDFKKKRCCYDCQVISDRLYQDKKFIDFINLYSDKSDTFLSREISSGRLAYVGNLEKKDMRYLSIIKISKGSFELVDFDPDVSWPVLNNDENPQKKHTAAPNQILSQEDKKDDDVFNEKETLEKIEAEEGQGDNQLSLERPEVEGNLATIDIPPGSFSSEDDEENNVSESSKNDDAESQFDDVRIVSENIAVDSSDETTNNAQNDGQSDLASKEKNVGVVDNKNDEEKIQTDNPILDELDSSKDSKDIVSVVCPEKIVDDNVEPGKKEAPTDLDSGDKTGKEKIHDTRSFFYLSFSGDKETEPQKMSVAEACALALKTSLEKGEALSLFKVARSGEREIDWVNHRLVSDDDLPDFIKGEKTKKITPSVIKKVKSTLDANEKSPFGARYFRLEWPDGSLGPKQMFVSDACALAFQKAEEIGDFDKVKLFKVTLKNGKEEEFNWSGKNIKPRPGQEEVKKGVGINISMFGNKKDAKTRNIKISGNFSFKFDVNIDID